MQISQFHKAVEPGEALPGLQRKVRRRKPPVFRRPPPSDWMRTLSVLLNQWRWSALFAISVIAVVTAVTFAIKPVYESEGRLQIDPPGSEVFSLDASGVGLIDSEYIATEAQKLQFDDLALATIRTLHLDRNPEFKSNAPSGAAKVNSSGEETPSELAALRLFKSRLSVRREPSSRLVGVSFAANDPRLSAHVVNTLMKLMVERSSESRGQEISDSAMWLSRQLDDIKEKTEKSTRDLASYGAKMGIADVDPNSNTYAEKMGDLNKQLV